MDWDNTVRRGKSLLVVAAEVGGTAECSNHWLDAYVLSINSVGCIIASLCHSNPVSTFVLHGDRSAAVSIQSIKKKCKLVPQKAGVDPFTLDDIAMVCFVLWKRVSGQCIKANAACKRPSFTCTATRSHRLHAFRIALIHEESIK